jgi:hypothetical protein
MIEDVHMQSRGETVAVGFRATIVGEDLRSLALRSKGTQASSYGDKPVSDLSQQKLQKLVQLEGYKDDVDLIADAVADSVCPAICMNDGCDYTTEMEPDQDRGWCENCGTNSLKSALVLAGII